LLLQREGLVGERAGLEASIAEICKEIRVLKKENISLKSSEDPGREETIKLNDESIGDLQAQKQSQEERKIAVEEELQQVESKLSGSNEEGGSAAETETEVERVVDRTPPTQSSSSKKRRHV
jgi:chromosome segregation ATPase